MDRANGHAATVVLLCTASVATKLREGVTRNKATLLVARMAASESVNNKRELALSQLATVLHSAKPFSILHSNSQFAIPWPSRTGSVNLHGASGFVLSRISVLLRLHGHKLHRMPQAG
jgi:hypothetical protein